MTALPPPDHAPDRIVTAPGHRGRSTHFYLLYTRTSEKAVAEVLADREFLGAYLRYTKVNPDHVVTRAELLGLLRNARVTVGIAEPALDIVAERVNAGQPFEGPVQVAEGRPPVRGDDEHVEFHARPTAKEARYETTQDGAIDYRTLNLVENCFAGQLIATRHAAREGRPGLDVHGRPIPATPGKPNPVRIGPGVALSDNGFEYRALGEGRVVYEEGVLSVSDEYTINGDVDFRVGHIDFVGRVEVKGSVLDGFNVRGKTGVRIHGGVEGSAIASDGDVEIVGGVKGRGMARIVAGGNVRARYLDECVVEAGGDVEAEREMVNASIRSCGRVLSPRATVVGGDIVGFRGVHVGTAGSPIGVASRIGAGINWTDEERLEKIDAGVAEREGRIADAADTLAPLLDDTARLSALTVAERALTADLVAELTRLREELTGLRRDRDEIQSTGRVGAVARLNVTSRAYAGVVVRFAGKRNYRFTEERRGPLAIELEPDGQLNRNAKMVDLPPLDPNAAPATENEDPD